VKANRIIGGKQVVFLGLRQFDDEKEFVRKKGRERLVHLLKLFRPVKIFTHDPNDSHPEHRAVYQRVMKTAGQLHLSCSIYSFSVWNLFQWKTEEKPKLVVDISETFPKKVKALKCFRSQINFLSYVYFTNVLYLMVFVKAYFLGIAHHCKYAEVFNVEMSEFSRRKGFSLHRRGGRT
jgi:N-acetylglucosamine malate deacetylase 1